MKISLIMTREIVYFCLKCNYAKTSFVNRIFDAKGNKKLTDSIVFTILNLICAKRNQFPVFRCNSILVNRWIGKILR